MTRYVIALVLLALPVAAQTIILPGKSYVATATARNAANQPVSPLPAGAVISWQESTPELVSFVTDDHQGTLGFVGKQGLMNTSPITGTLIAVYQDSFGSVRQAVPISLAPAPTPGIPPTVPPVPTVPSGSVVKSLSVTISSQ